MNIYQKRDIFRRRGEINVYRMFFWTTLILGGIWLIRSVQSGDVKPLFYPTPTPTRFALSYALEGDAQFTAGELDAAITAYGEAAKVDPTNAKLLADLARIQTYSSAMMVSDADTKVRLAEALASAEQAVALSPDDSYAQSVYAFVLDWNANPVLVPDEREVQRLLTKANGAAVRALQLDPNNTRALAFYAEILVDQQKWTNAQQIIDQALERDPSLMDVHRVHAYVLESLGEYALAIEAYDRAINIAPNLTFLHIRAGANYRILAFNSPNEEVQTQLFEKSLEYFDRAATINDQLGINDPAPYLSIAKTYSQMGQFFIAIRNVQKTIEFQPDKAEFYGELGVLYHKNRNYETGILALKCAIRGCNQDESCEGRGGCGNSDVPADVSGLPLTSNTVYYYDIYASELAALSTPSKSYCGEALDIASEIEASEFDNDPNIAADIVVVRTICSTLNDAPAAGAEGTPSATDIVPTATP
ncbi:tetratricopeptide repeat protein [Candidatus Villigracilis affinis]|uniref:tetratricopeptide repeat protein n=1 Tax=Candidatus Villigracilis affinis TaxID=3140682 RepID=UPI002A21B567|nr:tetratricopeptide repeat protein [Anaerolineales bacterium]